MHHHINGRGKMIPDLNTYAFLIYIAVVSIAEPDADD